MIYIDNRQSKILLNEGFEEFVKNIINSSLTEECVKEKTQISVILVDNEEMRSINREFRNIDKDTDVLSFPMLDYPEGKVYKEVYLKHKFHESFFDGEELLLGDIAISLEKSQKQSEEYNHSFERETAYLLVHSVLHLLGYDHMKDEDKKAMRKREEEILSKLSLHRD